MGRKTCKSSRKSFLSYSPLIFPHLILVILPPQNFTLCLGVSESNQSQKDRPESEQGAGIPEEHRCLHGVNVQGTVSDLWDAHDSTGTAFPKPWELGRWQHLSCAPEMSLFSDLHT